ncbi:hypothetical protein FW774_03375 (plasmid) [Pedobacter sp. BS3]|uniref:energy transducer TonB n=1 Tax=Pedobacter sp. BS3 TaxID=2567937 RepID=UPI0011EEA1CA|nr:energy transducer TonB [Pedobacter sp. BS3]TZF86107.1 hypothetical protein FW774_03375 [Pedobacter sp. BS3]
METNNIDYSLIKAYFEGRLDAKQQHTLEKQALNDPFLADAMEGYKHAMPAASQLSILQRQLEERIALQQERKNILGFTWQRISIAAAAGLMFLVAGMLFWLKSESNRNQMAATTKKVDVTLSNPKDLQQEAAVKANTDTPLLYPSPGTKEIPARQHIAKARPITLAAQAKQNPAIAGDDQPDKNVMFAAKDAKALSKAAALSEVAVTDAIAPHPVMGWKNYHEYIQEQVKWLIIPADQEGKVVVQFIVNPGGILSDFKITDGLTPGLNDEALRLIKEGPAWEAASNGKAQTVEVEIEFKAQP